MARNKPKIDTGGPAFPTTEPEWNTPPGLTRRQWYAGRAINALMSINEIKQHNGPGDQIDGPKVIAGRAFEIADAMIAHEKEGK